MNYDQSLVVIEKLDRIIGLLEALLEQELREHITIHHTDKSQ